MNAAADWITGRVIDLICFKHLAIVDIPIICHEIPLNEVPIALVVVGNWVAWIERQIFLHEEGLNAVAARQRQRKQEYQADSGQSTAYAERQGVHARKLINCPVCPDKRETGRDCWLNGPYSSGRSARENARFCRPSAFSTAATGCSGYL